MSDTRTLREILETLKRFNDPVARGWTSDNYTLAVAALELLDAAERETIPGPRRGSGGTIVRDLLPTGRVLIPDPGHPAAPDDFPCPQCDYGIPGASCGCGRVGNAPDPDRPVAEQTGTNP